MLFNYLVGYLDYKAEEKMNCTSIFYINGNQYLSMTNFVDNHLTCISASKFSKYVTLTYLTARCLQFIGSYNL